jgi:hypothetical protein
MNDWGVVLVPVFLVGFALFWMFVTFLISLFGWRSLAGVYRAAAPFAGAVQTWATGYVGLARYNRVLVVGADPAGLSLAVNPLFRAGSPPLFIPWEEVTSVRRASRLFGSQLVLAFRGSNATVKLWDDEIEEFLHRASGGRLPPATGAS